ncbi:MAG: glycosyltransferase [Oculatellaceae cyanobacterium Prado106]|jgi:glycosyltransferase involved in cell wall biosynthesis|nr:glycosyltransferase [Oculatellaceae cyanobacterium Prado106]
MKILHVNLSDFSANGGTGIGMHRLHTALNRRTHHQSKILCLIKQLSSPDTVYWDRSWATKIIERGLYPIAEELGLRESSRILTGLNFKNHPLYQEADVISLHCIHENLVSYLALPWITAKPTVLHVHDMWSFTGQCHYSETCDRWKSGCGQCPQLSTKRDNTHLEWQLKDWAYRHSNLSVACNSNWTYGRAQQSMLQRFPMTHIPLGLDTEIYRPHDAEACRAILGLPAHKKIMMFGALGLRDPRKGGDLLVKAIQQLPESLKRDTVLITMGRQEPLADSLDIPTYNFGFVESDRFKSVLYSAADLFLFPSRIETFGIVSTESMACGRPVVAFRTGGIPDAVRPGVTGLLAEPENVTEFRDCIVQLLDDDALRQKLGNQGREVAVQDYGLDVMGSRFVEFYQQTIEARQDKPAETEYALPG